MSEFEWLRYLHVSCAFLSIGGFCLRGYWMLTNSTLTTRRATRVVPHLIDTLLLASAIGMLVIWRIDPLSQQWLIAKLVALLLYIILGMLAFRFGRTAAQRGTAFVLALLAAAYIVMVAYTKSPMGLAA